MEDLPQFQLRARFCGVLDWICVWCGHLNRSRIDKTTWRIQCKAKDCRRLFTVGALLQSMGPLRQSGRRCIPPPDVTFPPAELDFWRSGEPVNRLILGQDDSSTEGQTY